MKAIVMAGGEGTRLRPLTCSVPKPMVTLLDKPMLEYTVEHLNRHGITEMAFTLMYKPSVITDYFENWKTAKIDFFFEDTPLGTAGSVKNASFFVDDTFLIISGDALTDIDITRALEVHKKSGAKATIVLKKMGKPLEYGVVIANDKGDVERFVEKPGWEDVFSDTVNTGIYILEPDVLDLIPTGRPFDFAKDLFPLMMEKGMPMYGHVANGYWCDVGNIESYIRAHEDLLRGNVEAKIKGKCVSGIYVGEGVSISNSSLIQSPSFIGDGVVIGEGAKIGSYSSIGAGSRIGGQANIKRSIIHGGASVGKHTKLSSCVVAEGAVIGERCSVYEGAVVGERCSLPGENTVSPRVKIWPGKWLSTGASAVEHIVWGYGERVGFLSKTGFAGDMGADLTPLRLGKIFGAAAEYMSGKSVAISCDDTPFGNAVMKQAVGVFTMSGCDVFSMHGVTKPVCAYIAGIMNASLCVTIKSQKQQKLFVDLFEPELFMLSKTARKKIEAKYFTHGEMLADKTCGQENVVSSANNLYINTVYEKIDRSSIKASDICTLLHGGRMADEFAEKVFAECDIRVKRRQGEIHKDIVTVLKDENLSFAVKVSRNASFCNILLPSGRELGRSEFESLVYYLIFNDLGKNEIILPSRVSRNVVSIAEIMGLDYTYGSEQEALLAMSMDNRRMLHDGIYAVCRLVEHIARTGVTLDEIVTMMEPEHLRVREVSCDWEDIGRVIKTVYSKGEAHANEGIRLDDDNGYGYICPHTTHPKIVIRTEGFTEEFAQELCDKYTDMVRDIIKN